MMQITTKQKKKLRLYFFSYRYPFFSTFLLFSFFICPFLIGFNIFAVKWNFGKVTGVKCQLNCWLWIPLLNWDKFFVNDFVKQKKNFEPSKYPNVVCSLTKKMGLVSYVDDSRTKKKYCLLNEQCSWCKRLKKNCFFLRIKIKKRNKKVEEKKRLHVNAKLKIKKKKHIYFQK